MWKKSSVDYSHKLPIYIIKYYYDKNATVRISQLGVLIIQFVNNLISIKENVNSVNH